MSYIKQIRDVILRSLTTQIETKRGQLAEVIVRAGDPALDLLLRDFANNAAQALMTVGDLARAADDWATADRTADQRADDLAGLERVRKVMTEYAADRPPTSLAANEVEKLDGEIQRAAEALAQACAIEGQRDQELRQLARQIARRMDS